MDSIDEYFEDKSINNKDLLVSYIKIAANYAPGAIAGMPYGVPGLKVGKDNLIAFAAFKNHIGVYPMSGKIVSKIKPKLIGAETSKGAIRYSYDVRIPNEIIKELVELRLKEIID